MLDPKKAEVNTLGGGAGEVEEIELKDINPCDETAEFGDFTIDYPYKLKIVDSKGKVLLDEKTQGTLRAKDWNKKFYVKESANGNEFVAYSRYMSLLAIVTIKKQKVGELPPKLNLNDLVGFKFDAIVVRLEGQDPFIDWVGTFEANNVPVPTVEELTGKAPAKTSEKGSTKTKREGGSW